MLSTAVARQTGSQPGAVTVVAPRTAAEAEALVGDLLPPSVQAFITATEHHGLLVASTGQKPPAVPNLTAEERSVVCQSVKSLSEILQPARERGPELELVIGKLFGGFNVYSGDEAKLKAQVMVWCEELEEFPLYAIRKAYKWAVRSEIKLPTLAGFIRDVKLAIGSDVLSRRKLLVGLVGQGG